MTLIDLFCNKKMVHRARYSSLAHHLDELVVHQWRIWLARWVMAVWSSNWLIGKTPLHQNGCPLNEHVSHLCLIDQVGW